MGREFELKYRARPEVLMAIRQAWQLDWQTVSMETTYYDTPAGDLSRLRWTLRCRMENGSPVCTVKIPAENAGRGEWEVPCGDIRAAIPELCKLGAPDWLKVMENQTLVPVCGARFTRQAALLSLPECSVELALDQGVLLGGGREAGLSEVEVEAKSGSEAQTAAFAATLAAEFGLTLEVSSKYRRALALAKGE